MKNKYITLALLFLISGCATTPMPLEDAKQIPAERVLAFQTSDDMKTATLTVIRDKGFVGSGCYTALWINQILAARLGTKEVAKFFVEPGELLLRAGRDPQGKGLCAIGQDWWVQRETILRLGEQKSFRLTIGVDGEYDIIRYE